MPRLCVDCDEEVLPEAPVVHNPFWVCGGAITATTFSQHGVGIIRCAVFHNPFGLWRRYQDLYRSDSGGSRFQNINTHQQ